MIKSLQDALPNKSKGKNCKVVQIPDNFFYFIITPIALISPKFFEALLRMSSNLSGFIPVHKILNTKKNNEFPLK